MVEWFTDFDFSWNPELPPSSHWQSTGSRTNERKLEVMPPKLGLVLTDTGMLRALALAADVHVEFEAEVQRLGIGGLLELHDDIVSFTVRVVMPKIQFSSPESMRALTIKMPLQFHRWGQWRILTLAVRGLTATARSRAN